MSSATANAKRSRRKTAKKGWDREAVLEDYRLARCSREMSLLGRREVLTGKGKFGIFGDGKELPQIAMARAWEPGDIRSGYYRDQTLMLALGLLSPEEYFAQLYADPDLSREPTSAGRQMNGHFATRFIGQNGEKTDLTAGFQSSSDVSPTGSQMPRWVGLGYASRLYRELPELEAASEGFSKQGKEISWGTIGNASTAEGMFWESVNAAGVLGGAYVISIWDDGFGISVPNSIQLARGDVGLLLEGFRRSSDTSDTSDVSTGYEIFRVNGWDYPALLDAYRRAATLARDEHVPVIVHIVELTQPQGHSTSGSHERYKSKERLAWEQEWDCLPQFRSWIESEGLANAKQLDAIDTAERQRVLEAQRASWDSYRAPIDADKQEVLARLEALEAEVGADLIGDLRQALDKRRGALRRDLLITSHEALLRTSGQTTPAREALLQWRQETRQWAQEAYSDWLYLEGEGAATEVEAVAATYADDGDDPPSVRGFELLNACFDARLREDPRVVAFGEDVGRLGDVNQAFAGLQEKYGELRVSDTGIRECTIMGQAIGLAMRGLRPIAEIQYLDYILYGLQILSDDAASLLWRTHGGQRAPIIVRTRGHRLEGVWHSGSPMGAVLHLVRGMHVCVPRDMTQAAGIYNTLLAAEEPAIVVEVLNGYRLKETLPSNVGEFRVPLGVPEVLQAGDDLTVATYGACCRVALDAATSLAELGIHLEVVDVQTLLPFDRFGRIVESIQKTGRVVFLDEDVPGGASAYMLQQVLEGQGAFQWLDSAPRTLTAKAHRTAYGSDGDYFSKPTADDLVELVLELVHEAEPGRVEPLS